MPKITKVTGTKETNTPISKVTGTEMVVKPFFEDKIGELSIDLGRGDLNQVVEKLNEVIKKLNER